MPLPFAAEVSLTDEQREPLERIARAASTPQWLAFRARIALRAAEPDRTQDLQIAAEFDCSRHTVSGSKFPVQRARSHALRGNHDIHVTARSLSPAGVSAGSGSVLPQSFAH